MDRCPKRCTICADIVLSASLETGDKAVRVTGIEQPHRGNRARAAPGIAVDHEAGGAHCDVERLRRAVVRDGGAGRMPGLCPWNMVKQPRAGWLTRKIRGRCIRHRREIDQPVLDGERHVVGTVAAGDRDHLVGLLDSEAVTIGGGCGAELAADQLVAVSAAERGDVGAHVGDLEHGRLVLLPANEGAGTSPPLDQVGLRELRQHLVHGHARAAVTRDQFMLERDAMPGRPFAGQEALLDISADPLVERRLVRCISGETHATSLRTDALKCSRAAWRSLCRPPSTTLSPPAQTQSIAPLPAAKIQPSMAASRARPASEGCVMSSVTMSARAPGVRPTDIWARARAPPASA